MHCLLKWVPGLWLQCPVTTSHKPSLPPSATQALSPLKHPGVSHLRMLSGSGSGQVYMRQLWLALHRMQTAQITNRNNAKEVA